jgi:hypothetical protein
MVFHFSDHQKQSLFRFINFLSVQGDSYYIQNEINCWLAIWVQFLHAKLKIYYILLNEILRNIDEIKCVFSFSVFSL